MLDLDLVRVASKTYRGLGSPIGVTADRLLQSGNWEGLAKLRVDPRDYDNPHAYLLDAGAASLLRKLEELPTGIDKKAAALATWRAGEDQCKRTNVRLSPYLPDARLQYTEDLIKPEFEHFINDVRKIIADWIGINPPRLENLAGRFGPGATYSNKARVATIADKMSTIPSITPDAHILLDAWSKTMWGRHVLASGGGKIDTVPGNRFATASKDSTTYRPIAKEPSINGFYQLGAGTCLRQRLLTNSGWNLVTAQSIHKRVARESSVSLAFATLDFSNASGTVSRNLVRCLFPIVWTFLLEALRSPRTLIDGRWHVLEQFSSMGNGFTFELETIIIAAIACAFLRKKGLAGELGQDVFVFGDDLIVPDAHAQNLKPVYEFFGLSYNDQKSFWGSVPFRESCGGDFFRGVNVRPFFLKNIPNEPADYIALANGITRLNQAITLAGGLPDLRSWFAVLDLLPNNIRRLRGPQELGDIVIHDADRSRWQIRVRSSIRYIGVWRPCRYRIRRYDLFEPEIVLACLTYGAGVASPNNAKVRRLSAEPKTGQRHVAYGLVPRNAVVSYKVGWTAHS